MKYIRNLIIKIKLYYYTFMQFVEDELRSNGSVTLSTQSIEREQQNTKLASGVRRLVKRLRSMSESERISTENLLCSTTYKKSSIEKMEQLRVQDKVNRNPILKTEDDLVNKVVKKAPIYVKEQDLKEVRKSITACLRAAGTDPTNPTHTSTMKALQAKSRLLRGEIERMKRDA